MIKELNIKDWIDENRFKTSPIQLSDHKNKVKVIFCFQSWCTPSHEEGFPNLIKMVNALKDNPNILFLAIQTVFEGFETNTYDAMIKTQKQYALKIPFAHDAGKDGKSTAQTMINFKTRGTPWFMIINQQNKIIFSDFHLHVNEAINFLENSSSK